MLNALAFVAMFIIGGLSGIFMAATPVDIYIHDTYFIVAHIHYVLFGGSIFGIFAAIYYWFPKMFGRMMNERLGMHPLLPHLHLLQLHVLPDAHRRHARPSAADRRPDHLPCTCKAPAVIGMNQFMTISAFLLGLSQLIFVYNFVTACSSVRRRRRIRGTPTRWSGRPRRRRRTTTSSGSRRFTIPRTNTACRGFLTTTCPRLSQCPQASCSTL